MKTNFSGKWHSDDGIVTMKHNRWSDVISVQGNPVGRAKGNSIYIDTVQGDPRMGVMNNKKIYWTPHTESDESDEEPKKEIWRRVLQN